MQAGRVVTVADRLESFLEKQAQTENSQQGLQTLVESLREIYGVEHAVYHAVNLCGAPYAALTYDSSWVEHYLDSNYIQVDPVVGAARTQFMPMDWRRLNWSARPARAFLADSIDHGLGNQGYSVPIRGPNGQFALFTINQRARDPDWGGFLREAGRDLLLISHFIHQKAFDIVAPDGRARPTQLSPRELDALHYLAAGQSRQRVAEALHISEHTLRVYVDSARYKLNALNTTHAVAVAMAHGLINL